MKDRVVQNLSQNGCTNIVYLCLANMVVQKLLQNGCTNIVQKLSKQRSNDRCIFIYGIHSLTHHHLWWLMVVMTKYSVSIEVDSRVR